VTGRTKATCSLCPPSSPGWEPERRFQTGRRWFLEDQGEGPSIKHQMMARPNDVPSARSQRDAVHTKQGWRAPIEPLVPIVLQQRRQLHLLLALASPRPVPPLPSVIDFAMDPQQRLCESFVDDAGTRDFVPIDHQSRGSFQCIYVNISLNLPCFLQDIRGGFRIFPTVKEQALMHRRQGVERFRTSRVQQVQLLPAERTPWEVTWRSAPRLWPATVRQDLLQCGDKGVGHYLDGVSRVEIPAVRPAGRSCRGP